MNIGIKFKKEMIATKHINQIVGIFILAISLVLFSCGKNNSSPVPPPTPTPPFVPNKDTIVRNSLPAAIMPTKTNDTKVYMHYMPWFKSKPFSGSWGSHWRMANRNPDNITDGKHQIASHYYPLIGPYDSQDPDVIEYHLLLMKYAGIDGIFIDWYGTHDVYDYAPNLANSNALIKPLDTIGMQYAIVYEEYTTENVTKQKGIPDIQAAQADIAYMEKNYFPSGRYIWLQNRPLLMIFGPRYFKQGAQWNEIFSPGKSKPFFLPLWHSGKTEVVGNNVAGEYSWVDFTDNFPQLTSFYDRAGYFIIGSAYPGFHDYYKQGGWGESYGFVAPSVENLQKTLTKAKAYNLRHLQLITWNDFGEGTMIEPTEEFQFSYLEEIQKFTGVSYTVEELKLIHKLYQKRKEKKDIADSQAKLNQASSLLNKLKPAEAKSIIDSL